MGILPFSPVTISPYPVCTLLFLSARCLDIILCSDALTCTFVLLCLYHVLHKVLNNYDMVCLCGWNSL
ncbi:hypothetical protein ARMSODRAFT_387066 [Armillaria solidipes]|uniref:Uncharacterized protein n=1 Tax=Armillaria solidipes TaxID=1076256 RepID=A0A2H3CF08_9AGAR|nr:hypothetical protein ARMSODRAFT_387066 [Armillaria solidipes]